MGVVGTYYSLKLLRVLSSKWTDTEAYKAGIVDETGKKIVNKLSAAQKKVYTPFDRICYNMKRLLSKIPGQQTFVGSIATIMWLMRENFTTAHGIIFEKTDQRSTTLAMAEIINDMTNSGQINESVLSESEMSPGAFVIVEGAVSIDDFEVRFEKTRLKVIGHHDSGIYSGVDENGDEFVFGIMSVVEEAPASTTTSTNVSNTAPDKPLGSVKKRKKKKKNDEDEEDL
jgi:hypothetical protein